MGLALAFLSQTVCAEDAKPAAGSQPALRPYHEIEKAMRGLLQKEAHAPTKKDRAAAAYEMVYLLVQIRLDPRLWDSDTLTAYHAQLRSRLRRIQKEVQRDMAREGIPARVRSGDDLLTASARDSAGGDDAVSSPQQRPAADSPQPSPTGAFGGRAGPPDWGPELVELIERTISPDFWDVHGGSGTIRYYAPLQVLVVRATDEMHHRVGGVIRDLRDAGR
jgi:hypothetical protein